MRESLKYLRTTEPGLTTEQIKSRVSQNKRKLRRERDLIKHRIRTYTTVKFPDDQLFYPTKQQMKSQLLRYGDMCERTISNLKSTGTSKRILSIYGRNPYASEIRAWDDTHNTILKALLVI